MENGFWVKVCWKYNLCPNINNCISSQNKRKLMTNYFLSGSFKYDFLSLLPLDLLYLWIGKEYTIVRLPRFLKFGDFQEFFRRLGKNLLEYFVIFCSIFTYFKINLPRFFYYLNETKLSVSLDTTISRERIDYIT